MPNIKRANTSGITKSGVAISDVPDAPTIGSATSLGLAASITYTPATTGGTATTFTAISTPGSLTGTGSSPIMVSGLTDGTSYTFTVRGSNSTGTGPISASSNSITAIEPVSGGYDALATVIVPSGGLSSIVFSNIPAGYKHLQIRAIYRTNAAFAGTLDMWMRFNSDTGSNYSRHVIQGNGAAVAAGANTTQTRIPFGNAIPGASSTANTYGSAVIDILDYASTTKNKTVRGLYGAQDNTTNTEYRIQLNSGLWYATPTAITSITLLSELNDLVQYSSFALYGVK